MPLNRPRVMVLLSVGRHPVTGRARRADLDARALELALRVPNAELLALHAGFADREAWRDYFGMGLRALTVLEMPAAQDPCSALTQHITVTQPDLVLCGLHAEVGDASGYLPYALARVLQLPLVCNISAFEFVSRGIRLWQALPRGRRRLLEVALPTVATVSAAAPRARQSAFARARRARFDVLPCISAPAQIASPAWQVQPARQKPKRLDPALAKLSGEERLKAMIDGSTRGGEILRDLPATVAAQRLLGYLKTQGVL